MRKLANSVGKESSVRFGAGKHFKAECLLRSALRGFLDVGGPGHLSTLGCMSELGGILVEHLRGLASGQSWWWELAAAKRSRYRLPWMLEKPPFEARLEEEAENLLRGALKGMEETLGAEHPQTIETLLTLGRLLEMKGDPVWQL
jgi:hypothetical protein